MKKIAIVTILIILFSSIYAQDKIVKLSGDSINCKVIEITSDNIKYSYDGEDLINNISKNSVKIIVFNSGRIQKFNTKIVINGEADWGKVQVTYLESDIEGLVKIKEIKVKSKAFMSSDVGKQQEKALIKLKTEAAKNGAHVVLILNEIQSDYKDAPRITLTGAIYKYK